MALGGIFIPDRSEATQCHLCYICLSVAGPYAGPKSEADGPTQGLYSGWGGGGGGGGVEPPY